jgi:hypothetical protein
MFGTSPKENVAQAVRLFYPNANVEVHGTRVKGRFGGYFLAEVFVDGRRLSQARHRDWRTAYKSLQIEFAKSWIQ